MEIRYDEEADALNVKFLDAKVDNSDEESPGVILDYDENGSVIAVEILDVSDRKIDASKIDLKFGSNVFKIDLKLGSATLALDTPNLEAKSA